MVPSQIPFHHTTTGAPPPHQSYQQGAQIPTGHVVTRRCCGPSGEEQEAPNPAAPSSGVAFVHWPWGPAGPLLSHTIPAGSTGAVPGRGLPAETQHQLRQPQEALLAQTWGPAAFARAYETTCSASGLRGAWDTAEARIQKSGPLKPVACGPVSQGPISHQQL